MTENEFRAAVTVAAEEIIPGVVIEFTSSPHQKLRRERTPLDVIIYEAIIIDGRIRIPVVHIEGETYRGEISFNEYVKAQIAAVRDQNNWLDANSTPRRSKER